MVSPPCVTSSRWLLLLWVMCSIIIKAGAERLVEHVADPALLSSPSGIFTATITRQTTLPPNLRQEPGPSIAPSLSAAPSSMLPTEESQPPTESQPVASSQNSNSTIAIAITTSIFCLIALGCGLFTSCRHSNQNDDDKGALVAAREFRRGILEQRFFLVSQRAFFFSTRLLRRWKPARTGAQLVLDVTSFVTAIVGLVYPSSSLANRIVGSVSLFLGELLLHSWYGYSRYPNVWLMGGIHHHDDDEGGAMMFRNVRDLFGVLYNNGVDHHNNKWVDWACLPFVAFLHLGTLVGTIIVYIARTLKPTSKKKKTQTAVWMGLLMGSFCYPLLFLATTTRAGIIVPFLMHHVMVKYYQAKLFRKSALQFVLSLILVDTFLGVNVQNYGTERDCFADVWDQVRREKNDEKKQKSRHRRNSNSIHRHDDVVNDDDDMDDHDTEAMPPDTSSGYSTSAESSERAYEDIVAPLLWDDDDNDDEKMDEEMGFAENDAKYRTKADDELDDRNVELMSDSSSFPNFFDGADFVTTSFDTATSPRPRRRRNKKKKSRRDRYSTRTEEQSGDEEEGGADLKLSPEAPTKGLYEVVVVGNDEDETTLREKHGAAITSLKDSSSQSKKKKKTARSPKKEKRRIEKTPPSSPKRRRRKSSADFAEDQKELVNSFRQFLEDDNVERLQDSFTSSPSASAAGMVKLEMKPELMMYESTFKRTNVQFQDLQDVVLATKDDDDVREEEDPNPDHHVHSTPRKKKKSHKKSKHKSRRKSRRKSSREKGESTNNDASKVKQRSTSVHSEHEFDLELESELDSSSFQERGDSSFTQGSSASSFLTSQRQNESLHASSLLDIPQLKRISFAPDSSMASFQLKHHSNELLPEYTEESLHVSDLADTSEYASDLADTSVYASDLVDTSEYSTQNESSRSSSVKETSAPASAPSLLTSPRHDSSLQTSELLDAISPKSSGSSWAEDLLFTPSREKSQEDTAIHESSTEADNADYNTSSTAVETPVSGVMRIPAYTLSLAPARAITPDVSEARRTVTPIQSNPRHKKKRDRKSHRSGDRKRHGSHHRSHDKKKSHRRSSRKKKKTHRSTGGDRGESSARDELHKDPSPERKASLTRNISPRNSWAEDSLLSLGEDEVILERNPVGEKIPQVNEDVVKESESTHTSKHDGKEHGRSGRDQRRKSTWAQDSLESLGDVGSSFESLIRDEVILKDLAAESRRRRKASRQNSRRSLQSTKS